MTPERLSQALDIPLARAEQWAYLLADTIGEFGVENIPMFIAQVGHESGSLRHVIEIWGPTPAQKRYEGRADLGNVFPGDGYKYRGRGLIQITGRDNYTLCGMGLGLDLVNHPQLLEIPEHAARSAGWYWQWAGCNSAAVGNDEAAFKLVTLKINGGYNGLQQRLFLWKRCRQFLEN